MTALSVPTTLATEAVRAPVPDTLRRRLLANPRVVTGGSVILAILLLCVATLPWTAAGPTPTTPASDLFYDGQHKQALERPHLSPAWMLMGTTKLGQSLLGRCLLGGLISLAVGLLAAGVAVGLGVTVGVVSGYYGGWIDALLMRAVDVLYGLPYILMVVLLKIALEHPLRALLDSILGGQSSYSFSAANLGVMFLAIGLVSWLTMARVIRGQVLSLRQMPFIDAAHALGVPEWRIFLRHLLPNLVGPVTVYATLTVPSAILQESTLSFLGIGIQPPLPTWGSLASEGLSQGLNPVDPKLWLLVFPCLLLAVTLLALNFLGDGLRDVFDPKRRAANV
jgi:oligopeptide transport system permease protein